MGDGAEKAVIKGSLCIPAKLLTRNYKLRCKEELQPVTVHGYKTLGGADLSSCVRKGLLVKIPSTQETLQPISKVSL